MDESCSEESCPSVGPTFDHEGLNTAVAEEIENSSDWNLTALGGEDDALDMGSIAGRARLEWFGVNQHRWSLAVSHQSASIRNAPARVDDNAQGRLARPDVRAANSQRRVVANHRFHTDEDSHGFGPKLVDYVEGFGTREALSRSIRVTVDSAMRIDRRLQKDMWATVFAPVQKLVHLSRAFSRQQAILNSNPLVLQSLSPTSSDGWIGVIRTDYNTLHARPKKRLSAGWSSSKVVARLERHVSGRALSRYTLRLSISNSHLLSVQSPKMVVPALSDDFAATNQHTSNQWVRHHPVATTFGELDGSPHEHLFRHDSQLQRIAHHT